MKYLKQFRFLISFFALVGILMSACGTATPDPSSANLFVVVGQSSAKFAGNGNGDGLLLDQFADKENVSLYVEIVDDRDLDNYRQQMINGEVGAPDVLISDDSLGTDGLQNVKLIASHKVGAAIREDIANQLGLSSNTISYGNFIGAMESGQLKVTASNALAGYASREYFFSTMAWCSQTDTANLTADILKRSDVIDCGTRVYNYIKSTNGSQEALDLVYNSANDPNGFNTVIIFDSDLLGDNGLNIKLQSEGKPIFKFFYFEEATVRANVGIGTRKFDDGDDRATVADELVRFFYDGEQGDASQKFINLSGFTEGSAGLYYHYDDAFNPSWGVASNPRGVQVVNSPVSAVAENGKIIYRDLYKRMKVVYFIYDTSGSTRTADIYSVDENGKPETITRQQAIARAINRFTDEQFQADNDITPGPKDVFKHYYFATGVSQIVSESTGPNTSAAGKLAIAPIGPAYGPFDYYKNELEIGKKIKYSDGVTPYEFGGTAMFDAADYALQDILNNYNDNADYYIVILTDGKKEGGMDGVVYDFLGNAIPEADSFYKNWLDAGKQNISVVGIQFGSNGNSLDADTVTKLMNGDTYPGTDDKGLVDAFKFILGN